jgi:4-hydroxybenzoate-CoA ligase
MAKEYKYRAQLPENYNITTRLIDDKVEAGLGDRIVVCYRDRTFTYRQLQEMTDRAGAGLAALGVRMEERILIVLYDSPEALVSFFGAIKIGAVPVMLNYMYTADDYLLILNDSRATTLIVDQDFVETVESWKPEFRHLKNTVVVGRKTQPHHLGFDDVLAAAGAGLEVAHTTADDVAFWNYTSGSTGVPKAAVHLQHDVMQNVESYARGVLQITEKDRLFSASKLFFAYGLGNSAFFPLATGASVVLLPDRPLPALVFDTISRFRPTVFFGVPTLYSSMLQLPEAQKHDLSSLRCCVSAGEALPVEIFYRWKERFGQEIIDGIGSTEMLHIFISNRPGDVKPGSSGRVLEGYSARIVDDAGRDVPDGVVGTLWARGDSSAAYYHRHHEKTKQSMLGEWFNTGDKYLRDASGYYFYRGRADDMLKVGGIWVSPVEIEDTIRAHPAVSEVAVVGKPDEADLIKPKAFVVLKEDRSATPELAAEIQTHVKTSIAAYKYPRWIEFVEELPKTATGKVQRHKLRE